MIRIDNAVMSSFHESFKNRERKTATITLSGSIPAFGARIFTVDIPLVRNQAVFEVYHTRQGNYPRRLAYNSPLVVDATWSNGLVHLFVNNLPSNLRIEMYVANNSSAATIPTQSYDIVAYVFDTPFSSV